MDLAHIIQNMTLLQAAVAITLCIMAVASLAVFVERIYTFTRARGASMAFAPIAAKLLEAKEYKELLKEAEKSKNAPLAALLSAGTRAFLAAMEKPGKLSAIEMTKRELVRKSDAVAADVKRGMSALASVGSVAPFVGLLGTVVGIIGAFEAMKRDGSAGITTVGGAIGEALIVTAFGLLVAIPAVLAYNFLTTRADKLMLAVDQAKSEFIDHLEAYHGEKDVARAAHVVETAQGQGEARSATYAA